MKYYKRTNAIENSLKENQVYLAIFLDVAQDLDKVWYKGLFHKRIFTPSKIIFTGNISELNRK